MEHRLAARIEALLGQIQSAQLTAEQGCTSEVHFLRTVQGAFILKSAYKDRYRAWLSAEAQILAQLKPEDGVPVPQYYDYWEQEDSSHLIMSLERGITLTAALKNAGSLSERQALIRSFGQFLQQFHEAEPVSAWVQEHDWLDRQLEKAQAYVELGQTGASPELLNRLKQTRPHHVRQTMVHGDCTTDNVLVADGEVQLFIDVAGMTLGDPRYDAALAIGSFAGEAGLLEAFYEGYTRYRISEEELAYFNDGLYTFF